MNKILLFDDKFLKYISLTKRSGILRLIIQNFLNINDFKHQHDSLCNILII